MSAIGRSKPSFVIYRDEPSQSPAPTTSANVLSPKLTISTSFSSKDKENSAPYPLSAQDGKAKGKLKASSSLVAKSAPTSPITTDESANATAHAIRKALATKFEAGGKSSNKAAKSKSSSSKLKSAKRAASVDPENVTLPPKLKRAHSSSASSSTGAVRPKLRATKTLAVLPEDVREAPSQCGLDGLTMPDRHARDLTQLPLADISAAFPTSLEPETFSRPTLSRKRSRADSIVISRDDLPSSSQTEGTVLSQATDAATTAAAEPRSPISAPSEASPSKRVRLSPKTESISLPPLQAEETLIDEPKDERSNSPTIIVHPNPTPSP